MTKITETIRYIVCENCGSRSIDRYYNLSSPIYRKMRRKCLCWKCAFWLDIIEHKRKYEVIDGKCYLMLPEQHVNRAVTYGMDGELFCMMRKDFTAVRTNDAWPIGMVPERFREKLPDTGWRVTPRACKIIQKRGSVCTNRYCMDRYHCLFYKWWDEDEAEIISDVPKDWKIGDEMCPSFVDFSTEITNFSDYLSPVDFGPERKKKQLRITKYSIKNGKKKNKKRT